MLTSLDKTRKILQLEIQNNYANRAIIGGLEKILPTLVSEFVKEKVESSLQEKIKDAFSNYSHVTVTKREEFVKQLLTAIQIEGVADQTCQEPGCQPDTKTQSVTSGINQPESAKNRTYKPNTGLNAPLNILSKIGTNRASDFQTLGVNNIGDLLYFFPRRYDDYSTLKPNNRLEFGDVLTIIATVQSHLITKVNKRELSRIEVVVSDGTGYLRLSFFRGSRYAQNFAAQFHQGKQLVISGKVEMYLGRKQMNDPSFEELDHQQLSTNGIIPVYPLTSGLSQKIVRSAIHEAIGFYGTRVPDFLPETIRNKGKIVDLNYALNQIHYPKDFQSLKAAQERLAFDEIFLLQLGVLRQKMNWVKQNAKIFTLPDDKLDGILSSLPYDLTQAQLKTVKEIKKDLSSGSPMNRLLQGDVGSGKTIVAALAAAIILNNQAQVVIMAPTSILAEQHFRTMQDIFTVVLKNQVAVTAEQIRLLTGDTPTKEGRKSNKAL
jgi:ATP-dependent DNA helicase RecG